MRFEDFARPIIGLKEFVEEAGLAMWAVTAKE
jgi:hypothetical protein